MSEKQLHNSTLQAIRAGDSQARHQVLTQFTPLVIKIASGLTGRYMQVGRDEEISVGLLALNEAIDRYDSDKGASFISFASMVISNRLRDYLRSQRSRDFVAVSIDSEDMPQLESRQAWVQYIDHQHQENRRSEVMQFIQELQSFGLDLNQLATATPRHRQARTRALAVARHILSNPDLARHVRQRKELPLKELENTLSVSRKTVERQRKYIISLIILLSGNYQYLTDYLPSEAGEND